MKGVKQIPGLVKELYSVVRQLESLYPGRRFTLDGHLVGSIGEVIAAHHYALRLLTASSKRHDAKAPNGKLVQIKATQGNSVGIRSEPNHLIVLKLLKDGRTEEVYNGPGSKPWNNGGKMQKNGQRSISLSKLRELMKSVNTKDRLKRVAN